jgi:polysaccharide export outer membrane protein
MMYHPQVVVTEVSLPSAVVTVSGDAAKPGIFPALGDLTLIDYISLAGGLYKSTLTGNPETSPTVTLIRPGLAEPVTIPLGPDPATSPYARVPVFAGDEIRIGKLGVVYAVGALHNQGAYPLKAATATTVTELIALAGGIGYEASSGSASIVRTSGTGRVLLNVDIGKILSHEQADIALQRDDILFVPTNKLKAAIKGGGASLIIALASAYIYKN